MTRSRLILLVVLSTSVSAGLTAWLTRRWDPGLEALDQERPAPQKSRDFHQWLHDQLELTPEQEARLTPAEERFKTERARLQKALTTASGDLAHALGDPSKEPNELQPLITERHRLQGELQKLIMAHLLEKRALLTPEQQAKYRQWVHESIDHDHGD